MNLDDVVDVYIDVAGYPAFKNKSVSLRRAQIIGTCFSVVSNSYFVVWLDKSITVGIKIDQSMFAFNNFTTYSKNANSYIGHHGSWIFSNSILVNINSQDEEITQTIPKTNRNIGNGMSCDRCGEHNKYAECNVGNKYICYSCRNF